MLINQLQLYTTKLEEQHRFYTRVLGFELLEKETDSFLLKAGHSQLRFIQSEERHYYHFAFNIPSFQCREALQWLKERVEVLKDEQGNEIVDFVNWNAEAIYFFDSSGNIVEFIARKNLELSCPEEFSSKSISGISEIGLPTMEVAATFNFLKHRITKASSGGETLQKYWGDFENFCAAGDELGLFILVNQAEKLWYPTQTPALPFPFKINFSITETSFQMSFDGLSISFQE